MCACGEPLFRYHKRGTGRLIKCFLELIYDDRVGVRDIPGMHVDVYCPSCKKRIGTIQRIHGKPALKLNQGTIKNVHIK